MSLSSPPHYIVLPALVLQHYGVSVLRFTLVVNVLCSTARRTTTSRFAAVAAVRKDPTVLGVTADLTILQSSDDCSHNNYYTEFTLVPGVGRDF